MFSSFLTSSTDFLSAWICMTDSAHSIMESPLGTLTRSCLRRPTLNSPGSSRRTVVDGRERSMVASRLFWSQTMALWRHKGQRSGPREKSEPRTAAQSKTPSRLDREQCERWFVTAVTAENRHQFQDERV